MNRDQILSAMRSPVPILVSVWSDNNPASKDVTATVCSLSGDYPDMTFVAINFDLHKDIAESLGASSVPFACVMIDGRVLASVEGPASKEDLTGMVSFAMRELSGTASF